MPNRIYIKGFEFGDDSDDLANNRLQFLDFFHIPTGRSVQFKAFLTSYRDDFKSDWGEEEGFGRMDSISIFKRTKRMINVGFSIPAASIEEAVINMERISLLISMLYPEYESVDGGASKIKTSPLFKFKFMNLIQDSSKPGGTAREGGLLGRFDGFSYEPVLEDGFFDSMNLSSEASLVQFANPNNEVGPTLFAKTLKITCNFTVIHQHSLGWTGQEARGNFDKFPYASPRSLFEPPTKDIKIPPSVDSNTTVEDRKKRQAAQQILSKFRWNFEKI